MIEAFNEKYPNITVEDQALPGSSDDVKKSLMTTLAAGGSDIDVIEADSIWVSQFAAAGWLEDLTEFLDPSRISIWKDRCRPATIMTRRMLCQATRT